MTINRQYPLVHHETVLGTGKTFLAFEQPESIVDFSDGNESGVRFHLDIHGTTGTYDSFKVLCQFQIGMPDVDGAGFAQQRWYELQPEQIKTMIMEGVDWYTPNTGSTEPYTITNLLTNPSWELDGAGALDLNGTGGKATGSRPTDGGYRGTTRRRTTWTAATTAPSGGLLHGVATVTAGKAYTGSIRFAASKTQRLRAGIRWSAGSTTLSTSWGDSDIFAGTTIKNGHREVVTATAPATADNAKLVVEAVPGEGASNWAPGDWLDIDSGVIVEGGSIPFEFDGESPNAVWDGEPHASTSTLTVTPQADEANVVATSNSRFPVTVSRSIKGFGQLVRVQVKPVFVNGSADAGIIYSLVATH